MKLSSWLKHFLVYGSGIICLNLLAFFLVPVYTHAIPPSDYGALELVARTQEILVPVLPFGTGLALLALFQWKREYPSEQSALYGTALLITISVGLLVAGTLSLFSTGLAGWLLHEPRYTAAIKLLLWTAFFEAVFQIGVGNLQCRLQSTSYVATYVGRTLIAFVVNMLLVYWLRLGLMGALWATLLQTGLSALVLTFFNAWKNGIHVKWKLVGELLHFGAPLVPGTLGTFLLNNGDRYFLSAYSTRTEVGIYGLGYKLAIVAQMLVLTPFVKIWSATMVDIARQPDGARRIGQIATYVVALVGFATLGISLFTPFLLKFLATPVYAQAANVVPVVGLAYIFYALSTVMDSSFYVTKRTKFKPLVLLIATIVVVPSYVVLISRYGMMGAAWATLIGFVSFAFFSWCFSQRVLFIHYEYGRIATILLLGIGVELVARFIADDTSLRSLALRAVLMLCFPLVLWVCGTINDGERRILLDSANRIARRVRRFRIVEAGV